MNTLLTAIILAAGVLATAGYLKRREKPNTKSSERHEQSEASTPETSSEAEPPGPGGGDT